MGTRYAGEKPNSEGKWVPVPTPSPKPAPKPKAAAKKAAAPKAAAPKAKTAVTRSGGPVKRSSMGREY